MEPIENWVSVSGAIASIIGALSALYAAFKASKSATKADMIRNEIVKRRKIVEVSQVYTETQRILQTVSQVGGPSRRDSMILGVNCVKIAKEVEEYTRFINEQSSHFACSSENKAKELCTNLNDDIKHLANAKTIDDKKFAGKNIYNKIIAFTPHSKVLADEQRDVQ